MKRPSLSDELRFALEAELGSKIVAARRTGGGSIATAYEIDLASGARVFAKTHETLPSSAFAREAEGLAWLAEAKAVRVPRVLAVSRSEPGFLALERIETSERGASPSDEERFGRELAALHRFGAPSFGLSSSNVLATLPQDNRPCDSWTDFYRTRRLEPLVAKSPAPLRRRFDRLYAVLDDRVGPVEPPARLHGDLWGGNRVVDVRGDSWVIDPAVYGGHREIDLAMMRLFGGFSPRVFAAYEEAHPLARGHERRVALYQLYPLLAHLVMFGSGYLGQVEETLEAAISL